MEIKQTDRSIQIDEEKKIIPSYQPISIREDLDPQPLLKTPTSKNLHLTTPENKNYEENVSGYAVEPCKICEEVKTEMFKLSNCFHCFCNSCLSDYITFRVQEAQVNKMPCPGHECGIDLQEDEIKQLISPLNFEKYQVFKRNSELNNNPFLRWCPLPDCTGYDLGSVKKDRLTCSICSHQFCYYCTAPWHSKSKCIKKSDKDLDEWSKKHDARFCPNCRVRVQKTVGCDHMTCSRCKFEWCWLCGEDYKIGHSSKCQVLKNRKWNKPLRILIMFIFSAVVLIMFPVFGFVMFVYETDMGFNHDAQFLFKCLKKRGLVYLFAVLGGLVLTPFYYALAPIVIGILLMYRFFKEFCCSKCARVIFSPPFGCLISPLVPCVALIVVICLTIYGLFFLMIKIFICIRRCFDPKFMIVNTKYQPMF
jgi:hypothetical protein